MFSQNFRHSNSDRSRERDYTIRVRVSPDAVENGQAGIVIEAIYRHREILDGAPGEWSQPQSIEVTGHWQADDHMLVLKHGDRELGRIPFDELPRGREEGEAAEALAENIALGSRIEEALNAIPVLDPVLGCLLKGAVTSAAGQLIRCWYSTDPDTPSQARRRATLGCLQENGIRMMVKFAMRTGRCMVTFGMW